MHTITRHGHDLHFDQTGFTSDPYVYQPLARGKVYEEAFLQHIRHLGKRGVYIDVGAHLGTHTVWFAALCPATHVHAFEPVSRFADVIQRNIVANQLGDKVTLHQVGLSDRRGQATNHLSAEHQQGFMADATAAAERFPIVRLDDVIGRREHVAVIKLDVEGMEASVLRGARRILARCRPVVYAEAHTAADVADLDRLLARWGYRRSELVFNASPTYEYLAPARVPWTRRVWRRLPDRWRAAARRTVRRLR